METSNRLVVENNFVEYMFIKITTGISGCVSQKEQLENQLLDYASIVWNIYV